MRTAYMSRPRERTWDEVTELESAVVRAGNEAMYLIGRERRALPTDEADDYEIVADILSDVVVDVMHGSSLAGDGQYDYVRCYIIETAVCHGDDVVAKAAAIVSERDRR